VTELLGILAMSASVWYATKVWYSHGRGWWPLYKTVTVNGRRERWSHAKYAERFKI
jgi:hypothetical protein